MLRHRTFVLTFALAVCAIMIADSAVFGQETNSRKPDDLSIQVGPRILPPLEENRRTNEMIVKVKHARIIFLSSVAADPGPDLTTGTADDDTAGPFFVVKGDITNVDGAPASGTFICRGVIFTSPSAPQNGGSHGVAQVNVSFDIDGRGLLMGQSVEFRPTQPAGAVIGGTGEFERMLGTYSPSGAPFPLSSNGEFTFTFDLRRVK